MAMANSREQDTQHGLMVVWGKVAQEMGLISGIEGVKIGQKNNVHSPQSKVIEMLVAILSGAKYLQDISLSAHPLDKDLALAQAWGQTSWADYSGVSRTLSKLSWEEARALVAVLERVSQPYIESELKLIREQGQVIEQDGDLTGIPVSNTSRTYPNVSFGHMDDEIRLGYQAGVTSFHSPTYGRLWLSVAHHAGDTVSCTQAEALVLAAEKRTGLRPRRRTELLQERIEAFQNERQPTEKRLEDQKAALEKAYGPNRKHYSNFRLPKALPKRNRNVFTASNGVVCGVTRRLHAPRNGLKKRCACSRPSLNKLKSCKTACNALSRRTPIISSPVRSAFDWMPVLARMTTWRCSLKWAMSFSPSCITTKRFRPCKNWFSLSLPGPGWARTQKWSPGLLTSWNIGWSHSRWGITRS
jgi:hypothetical protein